MRALPFGLISILCISASVPCLWACTAEPQGNNEETGEDESATEVEPGTSSDSETSGDGDGDGDETGDPPPVPENLPTPTGACPSFASGNMTFSPAGIDERSVKLWVGDNPQPGGMLVIYWHAYGSDPIEAEYNLSGPVIDAILDQGGVVAAPYKADDVGEFPWFVVNNSPRPDDMLLGDEIVACALEQVGIDPRRIHSTGMSAGGLQTVAFTMARSSYIASVTSFSGGAYTELPFEDSANHFAAMIIHGGDNDIFGGLVNFKTLSLAWFEQLTANGNFAFLCDHGGGHTLPNDYGASVANFFYAHPFGTEPSPYVGDLPPSFPADCAAP
jgi:hypothetical protein